MASPGSSSAAPTDGNSPTSHAAPEGTIGSSGNKEGWLEKKGAVNKNWRERWFFLSNGQLEYYVDKDVRARETVKREIEIGG